MRKFTYLILTGLLLISIMLTGCAGASKQSSAEANKTIKIGLIYDVTGGGSALGIPERNAIRILVDETNANGGINGKKIDLIESDNQSNETKALTEAKRMINEENVMAIIGGAQSTTSLSMVPTIEQAGIPFISNGSVMSIIQGKKWIFKTPPADKVLTKLLLQDAKNKGFKKIALLRVNNDYGKSGETTLIENAKILGMDVVGVEQFNADATDVKVQLTNLMKKKPDAVVTWAIPPGSAVAARDYYEQGYTKQAQFYTSSATANPTFIKLAGAGAEDVRFPGYKYQVVDEIPKTDPQYKVINDFKTNYEEKYKSADYAVSNAADAWYLLANAIQKSGDKVTKESIRTQLENTKGLVGQIGEYNMSKDDHNGLDGSGLVMMEVKDGKFVLAK
jgi:branched-chain amino acid transport system substrate-binding protein